MKNNNIAIAAKPDRFRNNFGYLFIGVWLCALIGFHKTYTVFFPTFERFHWQHHFHGAMMMSWIIMLIVQPFLIKYEKYKAHRTLGKLSYVLAPIVLYSMFVIIKVLYNRNIAIFGEASVLAFISVDIPVIFIFGLFFALSMLHRHKPDIHARYMVGTGLLMIDQGLSRALAVFGNVPIFVSIHISLFVADVLALLLLFHDFRKSINIKPALTILIFLIIYHLCWTFREAVWWQKFAKWFVTFFF
jgi:hypothetical protein